MNDYLKIIRPVNLGIIVLTQLLLRFCLVEVFFGLSDVSPAFGYIDLAILVLSTVLIAAGGYVINDYFDLPIDLENKPAERVTASRISSTHQLLYYGILTAMGILGGFYLAIKIHYFLLGFIFPAIAIMLWFYSSQYQKMVLSGNIMIAALSAMVIVVVWLFEFFALKNDPIRFVEVLKQSVYLGYLVGSYALFAFLVSLVREIVKDLEDIQGDRKGGYRTLGIVYGVKAARNTAVVFHVFCVILLTGAQYWLFNNNFDLVFWYVTIAVQLLFVFVLFQLIPATTKKDFHFLSNAYKMIMLAGILSMQLFYITY